MNKIETDDTGAVFMNIPCQLRKSGKRVMLIGAEASFEEFKNESLVRSIMKAYQWTRLLESGKFNTVLELANAVKIDRSAVARTLSLVNLAPDIVDIVTAIFNGTAPDTLTFAKLVTGIPDDWQEQRKKFGMA